MDNYARDRLACHRDAMSHRETGTLSNAWCCWGLFCVNKGTNHSIADDVYSLSGPVSVTPDSLVFPTRPHGQCIAMFIDMVLEGLTKS